MSFIESYKTDIIDCFKSYKRLADRALAQVSDEDFFTVLGDESNSLAVIVKHVGGNLRSRWRDFLTTDGEKDDRNRDGEFVTDEDTRESLGELWETGWSTLFATLESLTEDDFTKTVTIRTEEFSVIRAINRSVTHIAHHVGQIAFLAKQLAGEDWQTLSVPRNKSGEFASFVAENKGGAHYLDASAEFAAKEQK